MDMDMDMDIGMGIGFYGVAGFTVGFAATKLGKIGVIAIGSSFMLIQGLSHIGYVTVNWNKAEHDFNHFLDVYGPEYQNKLSDIVTNNLPSAAAFSTGILLGFRMAK